MKAINFVNAMEHAPVLLLAIAVAAIVWDALSKNKQIWRANLAFACALLGGFLMVSIYFFGPINVCSNCGEIVSSRFCVECGTSVKPEIICLECGAAWGCDAVFCGDCGAEINMDCNG